MDVSLIQLKHHVAPPRDSGYRRPLHLIQINRDDGAWSSDGRRAFFVPNAVDDTGKATSRWDMAEDSVDIDQAHFDPREGDAVTNALETWDDPMSAGASSRNLDRATVLFATDVAGAPKSWSAHEPQEPIPFRDAMLSSAGAFTAVFNIRYLIDVLEKIRAVMDAVEGRDVAIDEPSEHSVTLRLVGEEAGQLGEGGGVSKYKGFRLHLATSWACGVVMGIIGDTDGKPSPDLMTRPVHVKLDALKPGAMFMLPVDKVEQRFVKTDRTGNDGVFMATCLADGKLVPIPGATLVAPMNIGGSDDN